jgi:outer membrane protein assembly factor BamB
MNRSLWLASCVLIGLPSERALAENWPQWRGPGGDGVSRETGLPAEWSSDKNVIWKLDLPGPAGSTPVIWDDHIFLTSIDGDDLLLIAVSTSGKLLWKQVVTQGNKNVRSDEGNSASASPCTDGRHVWAFFANGVLGCYAAGDGREVWKLNVQDRCGPLRIQFGMTSTPVLDGDSLYLQLIHGDGNPSTREARIVALDKATGKELWQTERPSPAHSECEHSYASPIVYRDRTFSALLTHGADYLVAYGLQDGKELWRCGNLNPAGSYNPTLRFVASPVAAEGKIVIPSAKNGPVFCLKPGLAGDITDQESAYLWKREAGTPDVPSPLIHEGLVYLCRENGNLVCLDAQTGKEHYEKRTFPDRYRASPVYADGKIYVTGRKGVITVLKAGKEYEQLAQNEMKEEISASPAISNGRIYLRTFQRLYAIGAR